MKKVLFGIMALSMATFAATNPGEMTGTGTEKAGTASVPVKVLAEVIAVTDAIVITDEAGNIIGAEGIVLDHGTRTKTDGEHTTAPFRFKVKRMSETEANAPIDGKLTVTIAAPGTAKTTHHPINLGKIGGGTTNGEQLESHLKLENASSTLVGGKHGYEATMGAATEHTGEITSTVNFASANKGKYESGLTEARPELVVTIAATK